MMIDDLLKLYDIDISLVRPRKRKKRKGTRSHSLKVTVVHTAEEMMDVASEAFTNLMKDYNE